MSRAEHERIMTMTHNLYEVMPGAQQPPRDDRGKLWGEVENTEHYEFCNLVAKLIVKNSGIVAVDRD